MNFIISILFGGMVAVFGWLHSNKFYRHRNFFEDLLCFANYIQTNLAFLGDESKKIFENFKLFKTKEFENFLNYFKQNFDKNEIIDINNIINNFLFLDANEKNHIINFFNNFGRIDKYTQIDNTKIFIEWIGNKLKILNNDCDKKGNVYRNLSIMAGILVFVILI